MDTDDDREAQTDESGKGTCQERATAMLDQIAQQAKLALSKAGIDIELFFLVSQHSNAILTFGTPADPPDDLWSTVSEVVSFVVRNALGVARTRCTGVVCASTAAAT